MTKKQANIFLMILGFFGGLGIGLSFSDKDIRDALGYEVTSTTIQSSSISPDDFDDDEGEMFVDIVYKDEDVVTYADLCFILKDGREVVLSFQDDKLEITGMEHCDEVATMFFEHYLKPLADAYIAERIHGR